MKLALNYEDEFETEVDVDLGTYLEDYLGYAYRDVPEAVEAIYRDDDDEGKAVALTCKDFHTLADTLNTQHSDWVEDLISNDEEYMDDLRDDLKESNSSRAYSEYDQALEETSRCDPDGFHGWSDYYSWKNR